MMDALSNIQEVWKYDQEGNATDHRPTHDQRQRAVETEKDGKKHRTRFNTGRQQNGSNTLLTSHPPPPPENDWSNNIYYKQ